MTRFDEQLTEEEKALAQTVQAIVPDTQFRNRLFHALQNQPVTKSRLHRFISMTTHKRFAWNLIPLTAFAVAVLAIAVWSAPGRGHLPLPFATPDATTVAMGGTDDASIDAMAEDIIADNERDVVDVNHEADIALASDTGPTILNHLDQYDFTTY